MAKLSQPFVCFMKVSFEQSFFCKKEPCQPERDGKQQHVKLVIPNTDITGNGKKAEPEQKKACGKEFVTQLCKVRHLQHKSGIFNNYGNAAD